MHNSIQNHILCYMKTLAIAGAGKRPRHGLLNPKKFGLNGFQAALIARNQEKLDESLSIVYRPEQKMRMMNNEHRK